MFYCPGIIAASDQLYQEREGDTEIPQYSHPEFKTVQVIHCMDFQHNVLHMEKMCYDKEVPTGIFIKARNLNRQAGNVRRFATWFEAACDVRHFCRRIAALSVPIKSPGALVPGTPTMARLLAIYQSWPFEIEEPFSQMESLYKKKYGDKFDRSKMFVLQATDDLEFLYRATIPGHTMDIFYAGTELEGRSRKLATTKLIWEEYHFETPVTEVEESEYTHLLIEDAMKYRELCSAKKVSA